MIYFDNSATSYPKPPEVIRCTYQALKNLSFNSGRGGYIQSIRAAEAIYSVREKIGAVFSFSPDRVVFTKNCTEALNMAIKGSIKKGDHLIISSLEHNSVSRVAQSLSDNGIAQYDIADYSFDDAQTVNNFENLIRPNTKVIVCTHSSNAFGVTFPITKIGKLCRAKGIRFIVDGAQGAGVADINATRDNIDILCAPGHKCLMGIMGSGFMAIGDNVNLSTLMEGGTGSTSLSLYQPDFPPDRYEAGTLNNSGIISIGKGIDYINSIGMNNIYSHELKLAKDLYHGLETIDKIKLYTPCPEIFVSMPIISFNVEGYSCEKVSKILASRDICTRAGFHCSPLAHKHFNTIDCGTVRLSLGAFNNERECSFFMNVVKKL